MACTGGSEQGGMCSSEQGCMDMGFRTGVHTHGVRKRGAHSWGSEQGCIPMGFRTGMECTGGSEQGCIHIGFRTGWHAQGLQNWSSMWRSELLGCCSLTLLLISQCSVENWCWKGLRPVSG